MSPGWNLYLAYGCSRDADITQEMQIRSGCQGRAQLWQRFIRDTRFIYLLNAESLTPPRPSSIL